MERGPDSVLRFRRSIGWPVPDMPPPAAVPDDPMHELEASNVATGLQLDANTLTPGWVGERLDVGWAIDVLHPFALASRM